MVTRTDDRDRVEQARWPSAEQLEQLLATTRQLFPGAHALLAGSEVAVRAGACELTPAWTEIVPEGGRLRVYPIPADQLERTGATAIEADAVDVELQRWRIRRAEGERAQREIPVGGYAIHAPLHIALGVSIFVVRAAPFTIVDVRRLVAEVACFDPDLWRFTFLRFAAQAFAEGGIAFDPRNANKLLALLNDEERAGDASAAYAQLRDRSRSELAEYLGVMKRRGWLRASQVRIVADCASGKLDYLDYLLAAGLPLAWALPGDAPATAGVQ